MKELTFHIYCVACSFATKTVEKGLVPVLDQHSVRCSYNPTIRYEDPQCSTWVDIYYTGSPDRSVARCQLEAGHSGKCLIRLPITPEAFRK